jgi:hypothetical protein
MEPLDEDEARRLIDELEVLLRAFHARPDRCCHEGCLHCPFERGDDRA